MLPITKDYLPINKFSRDGTKLSGKKAIVMHYTASPGAPAVNIGKYFAGLSQQNTNDNVPDRYAGAHFSVDRKTIVQNIPGNERAYHVGSETYTEDALKQIGSYPNNWTVGIEMCIEKDGSIHEETFQNAADLAAYLIKSEGWPEAIWTHKQVVGWKDCPLPWVQKPSELERFKKAVADRLRPPQTTVSEEDEELKLVDWQWEMLAKQLHELYTKGLLTDYGWAEKASKRELTASELLFVNTVIINRTSTSVK